ncbi:hypothetical protein [Nocardia stercoris]|uniref:Uncharacterized protein n=1 Tax=Nocardia stercoris TaxID=2483361 RepID=A0A3M2L5S1_9NOCA|nr:hypothetical protein [Nocardia stercoris]RMI32961.1 hypothetical protein EBN03_13755 [Nocardia stercoris]
MTAPVLDAPRETADPAPTPSAHSEVRLSPLESGAWHWDLVRWRPAVVVLRCRSWIRASRRRRATVWVTGLLFVFVVFPGLVGAVATASAGGSGSSVNSGLSWMDIRDSSGLTLSSYVFATNNGSVLHPLTGGKALVLNLEFAGWLVIVTTGVWLIGYVLGFRWMDLFAAPLHGVAQSLTGQLTVPIVLTTAVTIGAFFVAWFWLRGYHAKAAVQVATMFGVVVLGGVFLSDPLGDVLSSDGWLAQGRDLGISISAGLNGDSNPQPDRLVASMQAQLADNFARRPLQVWNFGHVIDDQPACKAAWTAAEAAGDDDGVRAAVHNCGDSAAFAVANNPSAGQLGAGILLLVAGTLLLAFGAVLAIRIVRSALDSIYYGIAAIFGFAAGGYIYGPTQNFLIRCVVHAFFSAARMTAEITFLGIYVLFLGDLFEQARGQVMAVFVIGAIVEIIAIGQSRKLSKSLEHGNEWIANRFALAIQNGGARAVSGSGGSGGYALGMGHASAARHGLGFLGTVGAISTLNSSPATAWLAGGIRSPLNPNAAKEKRSLLAQWTMWGQDGFGGPTGWYAQSYLHRRVYGEAARDAARKVGGIGTARGAAAAIQAMVDEGASRSDWNNGLMEAGFLDAKLRADAVDSWGVVADNADDYTSDDKRLGFALAAVNRVQTTVSRLTKPGSLDGDEDKAAADLATLQGAAFRYRRAHERGVTLDHGAAGGPQREYLDAYMRMDETSQSRERLQALMNVMHGDKSNLISDASGVWAPTVATDSNDYATAVHMATLRSLDIGEHEASRMYSWIGTEHAREFYEATEGLLENVQSGAALDRVRDVAYKAQQTESWSTGKKPSPWKRMSPPAGTPKPADYGDNLSGVAQRMRSRT